MDLLIDSMHWEFVRSFVASFFNYIVSHYCNEYLHAPFLLAGWLQHAKWALKHLEHASTFIPFQAHGRGAYDTMIYDVQAANISCDKRLT